MPNVGSTSERAKGYGSPPPFGKSMTGSRFPKCFLSCSLDETDRPIMDWFTDLLYALEFEVLSGNVPEPRPPAEKVRGMIHDSDAVVAILTRRDRIESRNAWRPPEWVQNEIGMAYEAGKAMAVCAEEDVDISGLAPLVTHYERWNRGNLAEAAPRIVRYLVSLRNAVAGQPVASDQASIARALATELGNRVSELMTVEQTLELNTWNLSLVYGRITGRLYMLPQDVQDKVDDAYSALDEVSGLVQEARDLAGMGLTMKRVLLGKEPDPEEAVKKKKVKEIVDRIIEIKPRILERGGSAFVALLLVGWPEARQILAAEAAKRGLPWSP